MRGESAASGPVDYYSKHAGIKFVNALSSRALLGQFWLMNTEAMGTLACSKIA